MNNKQPSPEDIRYKYNTQIDEPVSEHGRRVWKDADLKVWALLRRLGIKFGNKVGPLHQDYMK